MSRKKGQSWVQWEPHEMDILFGATKDVWRTQPKLPLLVALREAQMQLRPERRRNLVGMGNIPTYLIKKFIDHKILPEDYFEQKGTRKRVVAIDPEVAALQEQLAEERQKVSDLNEALVLKGTEAVGLQNRVRELEEIPSPMQFLVNVLRNVIAEGVEEGLRRRVAVNPGLKTEEILGLVRAKPQEALPKHEVERRKDPVGAANAAEAAKSKPRFAVIGDCTPVEKRMIHDSMKDVADMRYIDSPDKMQSLKQFNANGGRIVLWVDKAGDLFERQLKSLGVSYSRAIGQPTAVIVLLKNKAEEHYARG